MDQAPQELAKDAGELASNTANEAAGRAEPEAQPAPDRGKAVVQGLAKQASKFISGAGLQAKQAVSKTYGQGSRVGEYVRQHVAEKPVAGMLLVGIVGFTLGYLVSRS